MNAPWINAEQERTLLETCLSEAKRRLDYFREVGDDIQAALTESDVNRMLDELRALQKRAGSIIRR